MPFAFTSAAIVTPTESFLQNNTANWKGTWDSGYAGAWFDSLVLVVSYRVNRIRISDSKAKLHDTVWQHFRKAFIIKKIFGNIPWQDYFQRILATDSTKHAQMVSYISAVGIVIMAIPPALIGAVATSAGDSRLLVYSYRA